MMKYIQKFTCWAVYVGISFSIITNIAPFSDPTYAEDSSLGIVMRRGHLRVGIDAAIGGPYMFWNAQTQFYDGFELEILQEIAARLNIEPRPINIPWTTQPENLSSRQVDLLLSAREEGALENGDTKGKFIESLPYYRSAQRLLIRSDGTQVKSLRDMIGKRVGVVANSGGAAIAETYNKNRGNAIRLFSSRDLDRMIIQLRDRQLDAMILDEPVAVWQVRNNPSFIIVGEPLIPIRLVAIINKDDVSLKKAIDKALTEMIQDGKLEQILKRWNLWESQKTLKSAKDLPASVLAIITPYSVYR
ncbi:MAG: amino acid ABC transporter substrate-binding protein [Pseudanabaena sp. M158S2SP1A06QC]|nr:amino acid ABC transporter substrate-binding protein [Pseudanabaena sp. M53BS1SP1A06MG]MCA6581796.1 amino acid ABC transporter substrate-binding protein [Pseudanabaena sp. M34BS1SP1A06MG]MCA6585687.1 amino acid ABC transporter substrate-binding protein [Pseudanabaena sp. M051S1SP1A06QC]MCA6591932.1 amino acid ABC transporter substrate-binding protein [Pseudanabaena sp. M38BS1SP1A06MG]MCA6601137.1 amino acid ABC transporter substrate-binding protein [Pseudanabaena sp. M57BS1SP1A06MG]MCA66114